MIIERYEIEVQILNSIFFKHSLRSYQLAEVQIMKKACFCQREELPIVEGRLISLNPYHAKSRIAILAHIEGLLVGCS